MRAVPFFLVPFLSSALAQTQPDAAEILKKVSEKYLAAKQFEFVVDQTEREPSGKIVSRRVRMAFSASNKYRMEGKLPELAEFGQGDEMLIVYDGSFLWFYIPKSNQYGSVPAGNLRADDPGDSGDMRPEFVREVTNAFSRLAESSKDAKLLREDALQIEGNKAACYVVSFTDKENRGSVTVWIDEKNFHLLRLETPEGTATYSVVKLDEPLSDDLFKFTPPAGAKKIELNHP